MKSNSVIHVLTSLDFGGVESHMVILAENLGYAEFQHEICAIGGGGSSFEKIKKLKLSVCCFGKRARIPNLAAIVKLLFYFLKKRPSVVHTHGAEANFHGLIAAWLAGVPVRIGEEIGIPSHGKKAKIMFKITYLCANKIIGISKSVTQWLIDSGEVHATKSILQYNPVRLPPPRANVEAPQKIFRIGFVGRLEPVKNPMALVNAFFELLWQYPDSELWIVGDGSQRKLLEDRAKILNIESKVVFYGFQSNPEKFINQCSVYVQPSISEGFGLALVEAMGCEVPVIATAVGGAPEILQHGITGWLVDRPDVSGIKHALLYAAGLPPEELVAMGKLARKSVETRFEPQGYIKSLEAIYAAEMEGK